MLSADAQSSNMVTGFRVEADICSSAGKMSCSGNPTDSYHDHNSSQGACLSVHSRGCLLSSLLGRNLAGLTYCFGPPALLPSSVLQLNHHSQEGGQEQ